MPEQEKSSSTEVDPSILNGLSENKLQELKRSQKGLKKMGLDWSLPQVALLELKDPEDEDEAPPAFSARRNSPSREFKKLRTAHRKKLSKRASEHLEKRAKMPTLSLQKFTEQAKRLMKS